MNFIKAGYVFGVIYGIGYGLFRFHWGAELNWAERTAITLLCSLTISGGIGAAAGFLVAFCQSARRRYKQRRSQIV